MKIITKILPSYAFDIRNAMEITHGRAQEIDLAVHNKFGEVAKRNQVYEMSTIIEECLNNIPQNAKEAVLTIVTIMNYEDILNRRTVGPNKNVVIH